MTLAEPRSVHNYIGGAFVDPAGDEWIDDLAPATGELIARIPSSSADDVDAAVTAAKAALAGDWGRTTAAARADWLDALADVIEANAEDLVALESLDAGKPASLARRLDIPRAIANFRFFAAATRKDDGAGTLVDADTPGIVELDPVEKLVEADGQRKAGELVPVKLEAHVTEVGTLELWCVARDGNGRWKLEYSVRERD